MPRLYFICVITLLTFIGYSQPHDELKAKQILQKSVNRYKTFKTYKADFKYTLESRMDTAKDIQSGTIFKKDASFRITFNQQTIITDAKTVWIYLKKANEVQVNKYNADDMEINPNKLFTMWEKGYLYGYTEDQYVNGKLTQVVELAPNDKTLDYFKVKLFIEKSTSYIIRIQTFYKNSNIMTLDVNLFVPNFPIADGFFTFDASKYPGVKVIDLRQ